MQAALTDNGSTVCSVNDDFDDIGGGYELNCIPGYVALMDWNGFVQYSYPGFSGSFQTVENIVGDQRYYTANVWGC